MDTYYTTPFSVPFYAGCSIPELTTYTSEINSANSSYTFNFSISNSVGYSGISCILRLNNPSTFLEIYSQNFTSNTTIRLGHPVYRNILTANVKCYYNNTANLQTIFADKTWLVDTNIQYEVSSITTIPRNLFSYRNLDFINFKVTSTYDSTPYPKPIKVILSSNNNLTALNCSGSPNITMNFNNAEVYSLTTNITCNSTASVPFNMSVYDQMSLLNIATANFTINWSNGNMVIDNINLIKRITGGSLELWATVSNDYDHTPIPDAADLTCNYTITSYDNSTSFSGGMELYRTYETSTGGNLLQVDAKNQSVQENTEYNLSNKFQVFIDCTADNYNDKTWGVDRWVGYRRLKTFRCSSSASLTSNFYLSQLYYSDQFTTENLYVRCVVIPDLDTTSNTSLSEISIITYLASDLHAGYSSVFLSSNMNADIYSACKDLSNPTKITTSTSPIYQQFYNFASMMHLRDPSCYNFLPLVSGKYSKDLVTFVMASSNNTSILESMVTPTTADLTFDLIPTGKATVYNTSLLIASNKTANKNKIENNNIVECITSVFDPSEVIIDVAHEYYSVDDIGSSQTCSPATVYSRSEGNGSYSYVSVLQVNSSTCPFFAKSNHSGLMVCKSTVYVAMQTNDITQTSNPVFFITPESTTITTAAGALTKTFDLLASSTDMVINPLLAMLLSNPLKFLLIILLIVLGIAAFSIIQRVSG